MTNQFELNYQYARWLASRFQGKKSANFVFDLVPFKPEFGTFVEMDQARAQDIAERLRRELSRLFFRRAARRYNKQANMTVTYHRQPHWHLHGQVEIPDHVWFMRAMSLTQQFVLREPWLKRRQGSICYFAETRSDLGTQIYNTRFGADSLILF